MDEIGEIITELRGKESLREASKKIGISHTYLDTIEKGYDKRSKKPVKPSPDTLRLISDAYNYPYEQLMKAAGYIDETTAQSNKPIKKAYDPIAHLNEKFDELGIKDAGFYDYEKWKNLNREEVEEVIKHFEYVVHKAEERKRNKKNI